MSAPGRTLEIRTSPHILSGASVDSIMWNVVLALLPTTAFAIFAFGLCGLLTLATAVGSCLLAERLACRLANEPTSLGDGSVAVTGLLLGLTLPPGLPLWMVAVAGFAGVGLAKSLFGGLGLNAFNPALVGRAFVQAAFPVAMTSWTPAFAADRFTALSSSTLTLPFTRPIHDGMSGATPLSLWKFDGQLSDVGELALGFVGGSTGETSGILILLGGAYLVARNMMNWRIPAAVFAVVALLSATLHAIDSDQHAAPLFMLFSGGLMLGAVFMATDMVASPMTSLGCWLYGALIGGIVIVIRSWGGMPEGVMYAILLANAVSPHIDHWIQPRAYGAENAGVRAMSGNPSLQSPPRVWPMYRALVGVGLACGLLIVGVFEWTRPVIERNRAEALRRAIFQVLPGSASVASFRALGDDGFVLLEGDAPGEPLFHAGFDTDGKLVGVALEAAGTGYQDVIRLIYGYAFEPQAVIGIRVLESRETPGLGDRIETDPDFLENFERLDVSLDASGTRILHPIEAVKSGAKQHPWQIDGITGATISSAAIAEMLRASSSTWIPRVHRSRADFRQGA